MAKQTSKAGKREAPGKRRPLSARKTSDLPDQIKGIPRYVTVAEFEMITSLSRDTILRGVAAGKLPPLHSLSPGRVGMLVTDVREYQLGRRSWPKLRPAAG